ncbi:MAG TPA: alpha/beta fold hydrolase [Polyangiaceae bacterium]
MRDLMRFAKGMVLPAATIALATGCTVTLGERNMFPQGEKPMAMAPAGVAQEAVELPVDGATLRGWLFHAPSANKTIVYFYGAGGSVLNSAGELLWLSTTLSADVISLDYRGHGFSDGKPSFVALGADAVKTVDWAKERFPDRPLFLLGYSLGTTMAVHAAASRPVAGVALLAPPTSIDEMAQAMRARGPWYYRFVTVDVEPSLLTLPQPRDEVTKVISPLLIIHGTDDQKVPYWMGEKMLARAGTKAKQLCPVAHADHHSVLMSKAMIDCLARFVSTRR